MPSSVKQKTSNSHCRRPIGVFDSGVGGLTVVHGIRQQLPNESIVYFGDMARLPYGTKSKEQIVTFSVQNTLFLLKQRVKAVVVACNSSSSAAYQFLKNHFSVPILDVIEPAAKAAVAQTKSKRIGVIATQATVESAAYNKAIAKIDPAIKVESIACPLFVPLVEEGWLDGPIPISIVHHYLKPFLTSKIDTLILGCTHYPLLKESIQTVLGSRMTLVDSVRPTVEKLSSLLSQNGLSYPSAQKSQLKIYVSDKPRNFVAVGEKFLGERIKHIEIVRQK